MKKTVMPLRTLTQRLILMALLIISNLSLAYADAPTTGWLSSPDHPPVQLELALTGQYEAERRLLPAILQVKLDDGWKTYWRAPGEGGIPPTLDWSTSRNIEAVEWFWPLPQHYQLQGIKTVGYQGDINFPLLLKLSPNSTTATLRGTLTLSSCTTICVLTDYAISLNIDLNTLSLDSDRAFRFSQAMSQVPQPLSEVSVSQADWDAEQQLLQLRLQRQQGWQQPELFFYNASERLDDVAFDLQNMTIDGNELQATVALSHWLEMPDLNGAQLGITVSDGDFAGDYQQPLRAHAVTVGNNISPQALPGLTVMLLLALAGGLILNIMPCVLPVLGLKIHSLIAASDHPRSLIRGQFAATAAGIIVSFWLLAALLIGLRSAGASIGWGIQFQNSYFIATMVVVTALFSLNLLGLFEVRLPNCLSSWAGSRGEQHRYRGHFLQGMLATLLATPCTAPFLGTAVAFALAANNISVALIFTALGIGMALPWLVIATRPSLARWLPKPGPWLAYVKPLLALLLLATSGWLLSLMVRFIGLSSVLLIAAVLALLVLLLLAWRYGRKGLLLGVSGLFISAATLSVVLLLNTSSWAPSLPPDHDWQALPETDISAAVDAGYTVFVDVTADWCITCKANKLGVLLQQPVYQALAADNIIRVRGDWTVPSAAITGYLKDNNTFGVPFNKVYGPGAQEGIQLPIMLTDRAVMDALEQANGRH